MIVALPEVLAGPIVRKLTHQSISVWFLTSQPPPNDARLEVFRAGNQLQADVEASGMDVVRCGSNCYAVMFRFRGQVVFEANQLHDYRIADTNGQAWQAVDWASLDYRPPANLPAFLSLPPNLADFSLQHASCRKPHAGDELAEELDQVNDNVEAGVLDALALLDRNFIDAATTPAPAFAELFPRPHLLLLSGDQIYADDVAGPMMGLIKEAYNAAIGDWDHHEPDFKVSDEGVISLLLPPITGRKEPGKQHLGYTAGPSTDHLWRFGEFMMMYAMVWSPALWDAARDNRIGLLPAFDDVEDANRQTHTFDAALWQRQVEALTKFHQSLPRVRKLLANVATLMLFDDHEVTDDWNLNHRWCREVYGKAPGRRAITSGLAAYTVCQHWGNAPELGADPTTALARALANIHANAENDLDVANLAPLLGVPDADRFAPEHPGGLVNMRDLADDAVRFDFILDDTDGYPCDFYFTDPRTARAFVTDFGPSWRIAPDFLADLLPLPTPGEDDPTRRGGNDRTLITVLPAPLLGFHFLEHFVQPLAGMISYDTATGVDVEPWSGINEAFETVLRSLSYHYRHVVALSGDVHYGFTKSMSFVEGNGNQPRSRMAQFTCSSAKHPDIKTMVAGMAGDLAMQVDVIRHRSVHGFDHRDGVANGNATWDQRQRLLWSQQFASPPAQRTVVPWDDLVDVTLGRVFRAAQRTLVTIPEELSSAYGVAGERSYAYQIKPIDSQSIPAELTAGRDYRANQVALGFDPGAYGRTVLQADLQAVIDVEDRTAVAEFGNGARGDDDWGDLSALKVKGQRSANLHRLQRVLTGLPQVGLVRFFDQNGQPIAEQTLYIAPGTEPTYEFEQYLRTSVNLGV